MIRRTLTLSKLPHSTFRQFLCYSTKVARHTLLAVAWPKTEVITGGGFKSVDSDAGWNAPVTLANKQFLSASSQVAYDPAERAETSRG